MALNLALAVVATLLIVFIVRQFVAPMPLPIGGRRAAAPGPTPAAAEAPRPPAGAYTIVASRNLFSPTRTEAPVSAVATAIPLVRPNLFGVVVRDVDSIAYLEDPATKRVAGYHVGDRIVGGTVKAIKADGVEIERPEGPLNVRLRDPGKPRTAQPAAAAAPQPSAAPTLPGIIPPAAPTARAQPQSTQPAGQPTQPQAILPPAVPSVLPPGQSIVAPPPVIPGRRPLPPNLLRRLPPGLGDAPQQ